ncbi:hypothetical protein CFOL_v3_18884 [Cephalotus follicularis]|uniref:Uncharacterized protein n=1 Tax=Cephalotus follicularis TaxID=3775 RepID=A0A1Q3C587_CEPFO|nr:hypothetical protein CFOL_v3_18884 [Cephalotus follicularis]
MSLFASIFTSTLSVSLPIRHRLTDSRRFCHHPLSSVSSSTPDSSPSQSSSNSESIVSSKNPSKHFVESSRPTDSSFNYAIANPNDSLVFWFLRSTKSNIERVY